MYLLGWRNHFELAVHSLEKILNGTNGFSEFLEFNFGYILGVRNKERNCNFLVMIDQIEKEKKSRLVSTIGFNDKTLFAF